MAAPETMKFGKFKVLLGNGAEPEVFTAPCGFTSKSFNRSKTLNEVNVPDCDDPDQIADVARDAVARSATITGSGVMAKSAYPKWKEAYDSSESINCKIVREWADGSLVTTTQRFHLESLEEGAELGDRVQVSVTMQSDGPAVEATTP